MRLAERGWFVVRAAGSRGPVDLVAVHDGRPVALVQCKLHRERMEYAEWHELWSLAVRIGATPYIADRSGSRGVPVLWELIGDRPRHARLNGYLVLTKWEAME